MTCPKLLRFPAHPAAAKKSEGERVNVEDLIIKIDVTTGRERWQRVGDSNSMLVASGQAKTFTEYDRYGLAITTYEMEAEKYIYRVYKYEL